MSDLTQELEEWIAFEKEATLNKNLILEKALKGSDPNALLRASSYINSDTANDDSKSYIYDPQTFFNSLGYKDNPNGLSYQHLRQMARTPINRAIIGTRQDQVAAYSEPVDNDQEKGWMIRKKKNLFEDKTELSYKDKQKIELITKFMMNCGFEEQKWTGDSFEMFLRKITKDTLELDQMTFEIIPYRSNKISHFMATDGATYRHADHSKESPVNWKEKQGYLPNTVQIYQNQIYQEFYPWELCFATRNQSTNVWNNGYGISELEDLVRIVTWTIYSDEYNGKFFSQGAAPKGILKVSGGVSSNKLEEFKRQWRSTVAGVQNAWKTPVIESDKMEFIDLQQKNTDMQFQQWQEYLTAMSCAVFKINPEEIGLSVGQKGNSLFQGGEKERLEHSKQKGLIPLLKFTQRKFNKFLIERIDPSFEFVFVGHSPEDQQNILELNLKKMQTMPLDKYLEENGYQKMDGADKIILNQQFLAWKQQAMMGGQENNEAVDEETGDSSGNLYNNAFDEFENETEKAKREEEDNDPILDAFDKYIKRSGLAT